jgi:NitT/TauT family transport system substrate-binding protein
VPSTTLKVSLPVLAYGQYAPLFVAREKGWFKEEHIDIEFVSMPGTTAVPALSSGDIDVSTSSGSAINAILQGADLRVIMAANETSPYFIYTNKPGINSLKDIEGKTFGIQSRGDSHNEAAILAFVKAGVDPTKVTFVALGSGTGRLTAVANKSVDASTMLDSEKDQLLKLAPQARQLADLRALGVKQHTGGLAVRTDSIQKKKTALLGFLRALDKGILFTQKYPDKAVDLWMATREIQEAKVTRAVLDQTVKAFFVEDKPILTGMHSAQVQKDVIDIKKQYIVPGANASIGSAQVFDFSLVQKSFGEVKDSGWKP